MSVISMKQLLEAGVHFGHQTRRWNPKMAPYIYTERNGIHIIDLQKSVGKVDEAYKAVSDIAAEGGTILFVGTFLLFKRSRLQNFCNFLIRQTVRNIVVADTHIGSVADLR